MPACEYHNFLEFQSFRAVLARECHVYLKFHTSRGCQRVVGGGSEGIRYWIWGTNTKVLDMSNKGHLSIRGGSVGGGLLFAICMCAYLWGVQKTGK